MKVLVIEDETNNMILMKIRLPGIDGLETTRRIRKMKNMVAVPIIAVSPYSMIDDLETIKNAGSNGCLQRPINPLTLNDKIMGIIEATK